MPTTKALSDFLKEQPQNKIGAVAAFIESHVRENWQEILVKENDRLLKAYAEAGDPAYGTYLNLLLLPVRRQLNEAGLRPEPRLPGNFDISREWGRNPDQSDQERWMWSTLHPTEGPPVGTIVTITYHDHTRFRIPRQPGIIALTETGQQEIVEALSRMSADFKQALEFSVEYENYLRSLEQ
ncbi:hypothetical protein YDYSY3_36740 [Paenibacillus chitinolyticus]|uniref:DUF6022 family protein n=1 Tax=Paenibacillus chitinolyticus TaxID=79263 RepID=UPI0026E4E0A4|nr:DUF6022 family protein [Paenibacillus chitinolyticus]GKS12674.1 hypothetical protein YDYSY3_36740 [Paenibacillus chitinolyticus]